VARPERTGVPYDLRGITHPSVSVVPIESRRFGHRHPMQPKTSQAQRGARSKDQGLLISRLPFVSAFEVLFVGGNNHQRKGLFDVSQVLNMDDKRSRRSVITANTAQHPLEPGGPSWHRKARFGSAGRPSIGAGSVCGRPVRDDDVAYANPISLPITRPVRCGREQVRRNHRASTRGSERSPVQASTRSWVIIFATVL